MPNATIDPNQIAQAFAGATPAIDPNAIAQAFAGATPAPSAPRAQSPMPTYNGPLAGMVTSTAQKYGIDPTLALRVMQAESSGDQNEVSPTGARGLFQLEPDTAKQLDVDPNIPAQNVDGGVRYLKSLIDQFGGNVPNALAAYNAGPGAVHRYGGVPPFAETQDYVKKIMQGYTGNGVLSPGDTINPVTHVTPNNAARVAQMLAQAKQAVANKPNPFIEGLKTVPSTLAQSASDDSLIPALKQAGRSVAGQISGMGSSAGRLLGAIIEGGAATGYGEGQPYTPTTQTVNPEALKNSGAAIANDPNINPALGAKQLYQQGLGGSIPSLVHGNADKLIGYGAAHPGDLAVQSVMLAEGAKGLVDHGISVGKNSLNALDDYATRSVNAAFAKPQPTAPLPAPSIHPDDVAAAFNQANINPAPATSPVHDYIRAHPNATQAQIAAATKAPLVEINAARADVMAEPGFKASQAAPNPVLRAASNGVTPREQVVAGVPGISSQAIDQAFQNGTVSEHAPLTAGQMDTVLKHTAPNLTPEQRQAVVVAFDAHAHAAASQSPEQFPTPTDYYRMHGAAFAYDHKGQLVPPVADTEPVNGGLFTGNGNPAVGSTELFPNRFNTQAKFLPSTASQPSVINGRPADLADGQGVAYAFDNTPVTYHYAVKELDELQPSQLPDGRPNPEYDQELQPRDRTRASSTIQVAQIAGNLNPYRLAESPNTYDGAPIVGPDNQVESGNGRTMAIGQAYARGGSQADLYRSMVEQKAAQLGIPADNLADMKQPVLVRVRDSELPSNTSRGDLAEKMGQSGTMGLSPAEQAINDGTIIVANDMLRGVVPDASGNIGTATNADFVRKFIGSLPPDEQSKMYTADAKGLTPYGATRIRNAVVASAYPDAGVINRMTDSLDDNVRNIGRGISASAAQLSALRSKVLRGDSIDYDITNDVAEAANRLSALRDRGISLDEDRYTLARQGSLDPAKTSPVADTLATVFDMYKRSGVKIAHVLGNYARLADTEGDTTTGDLFGGGPKPSKEDLLDAAIRETERRHPGDEYSEVDTGRAGRAVATLPEIAASVGEEHGGQPGESGSVQANSGRSAKPANAEPAVRTKVSESSGGEHSGAEGRPAGVSAPPAKTVQVTVDGTTHTVQLTPEQEAAWNEAEQDYKTAVQRINNNPAFIINDGKQFYSPERDASDLKAVGVKWSAEKRRITGILTEKEALLASKREASNYTGKKVSVNVNGKTVDGTVAGNSFGKVRVQLDDGSVLSFDGNDVKPAGSGTLHQEAKGSFTPRSGQPNLITFFKGHDVSTVLHEWAHNSVHSLQGADRATVERWNNGQIAKWTEAQHERFAKAFERYVYDGATPTKPLVHAFEVLKNALRSIYRTIKGSPIEEDVHPELRKVFDRMFGYEGEPNSEGVVSKPNTLKSIESNTLNRPSGGEVKAVGSQSAVDAARSVPGEGSTKAAGKPVSTAASRVEPAGQPRGMGDRANGDGKDRLLGDRGPQMKYVGQTPEDIEYARQSAIRNAAIIDAQRRGKVPQPATIEAAVAHPMSWDEFNAIPVGTALNATDMTRARHVYEEINTLRKIAQQEFSDSPTKENADKLADIQDKFVRAQAVNAGLIAETARSMNIHQTYEDSAAAKLNTLRDTDIFAKPKGEVQPGEGFQTSTRTRVRKVPIDSVLRTVKPNEMAMLRRKITADLGPCEIL